MGSSIIMQIVNSLLLAVEFFGNPVQFLTIEISSDGTTSWKHCSVNNLVDAPPNFQHQPVAVAAVVITHVLPLQHKSTQAALLSTVKSIDNLAR
ncbi:unnamed protein product [Adineta ricciae]|uniref:Uncharacterized protein n=1 Tax=Adineta ricciae TaxID=249248 RepID=A0A814MIW6_ADIRI|nr:unnamed protein product [Adineta ricciae]CAF1609289.1 unnamed protein product [Adineta ricciae]